VGICIVRERSDAEQTWGKRSFRYSLRGVHGDRSGWDRNGASRNSSDTDVSSSGHVITRASVEEDSPPPLRCDAESVAGVQFVQLQKLFLG